MAFGRGKVILLGEHGVVFGRPALACGIERGVTATAREADRALLSIPEWGVAVELGDAATPSPSADDGGPLAAGFEALLGVYEARPTLAVEVDVQLPPGAGLGCSAALGVAILGAMDDALGITRSPEERASTSLAFERVFHGTPSGVDSAMAASGGVAVFQRERPLERVRPRRPLTLVIGNTGEPSSTKDMVASVRRQRERNETRIDELFDAIAALVRNGRLAIEAGDTHALGRLMDLNQNLLSSLLLSTPRIEVLCRRARAAGAKGAKLTGAGGGGCVIALAEDAESAERIRLAMHDGAGAHEDADAFVADTFVAEVGT